MFPRSTPYCLWQHAYTELLNASILQQAKKEGDPSMAFLNDPIAEATLYNMNVPIPIHKYIEGATKAMSPLGELVHVNRPAANIPCGKIPAAANAAAIESGSFGPLNDNTHNAYECYVAPYITRKLIEHTLTCNTAHCLGNNQEKKVFHNRFKVPWNPFPAGTFPAAGIPNKNLLGYRLPE